MGRGNRTCQVCLRQFEIQKLLLGSHWFTPGRVVEAVIGQAQELVRYDTAGRTGTALLARCRILGLMTVLVALFAFGVSGAKLSRGEPVV